MKTKTVVDLLNRIMEMELAGVVRYTHYSLMVYGYTRIPIVAWLRGEATTSMAHATEAGELVTQLGAHPSLGIGPLLETHEHDIGAILRESLEHEEASLKLYRQLLKEVAGESVLLEEYARKMIAAEEQHLGEVDKMLRNPGDIGTFAGRGAGDEDEGHGDHDGAERAEKAEKKKDKKRDKKGKKSEE